MSDQAGTAGGEFWADVTGERALDRYSTLVNMVDDGIYQLDAEGRFVAVNDTIVDLTRYSREELLGADVSLVLADEDVSRIQHVIERRLSDDDRRDDPIEFTAYTADGDTIPCELEVHLLVEDGAFEGSMGVVRDITERKQVERDLQQERDLVEGIVETSPVGIAVVDADGVVTFANERAEEIYGRSRDELSGFSHDDSRWDLVDENGDPIEAGEAPFDRVVTQEVAVYDQVLGLRRPSGERVWVSVNGAPQWNGDGELERAVFAFEDIMDQVEREWELERALDLLERTERIADVGGWEINVETEDVFWTDHTFELLDVSGDEEPPLEEALDMYHDDDQPIVKEAVEQAMATGDSFDIEVRLVTGSGELRWLRLQGMPETRGGDVVSFRGAAQDVTERKQREQRLEESEERFRMLAENLEEMVWLSDPETREILYLNPAYEEIWGLDRKLIYDDPTTFLETVHPDDRECVEQAYAAVPDEGFDEEYRIVRPDGEVRWLNVRAEVVRSEGKKRVVGIADDITERREREQALEESERRYRTLAENFPNGAVGLYNETLEYTAVGGQLLDATGVDPEDRIGNSVYDIYPEELVEEVEPYFHAALDGEADSFEVEFHNRHLLAHTLPVRNTDDEVFAGMLVVQDITEQREYERKLEESNERLEQFAYAASHDLQEPLRMVSSYLQLVESRYADELDDDGREFIEFAVDGAERMREMIEGLLQYSRVDTRGDPFEQVDLDAVVADVRQDLQVKIEESDAEITIEDLPRVYGDGSQLNQVFQNLLDNAIEYSGDDPPRVHIGAERDGDQWEISVSDEGIGIDADDIDRVFEVFERLGSKEEAGTGIGLALVERIVERHGGDIWVDSDPGEGATFSFTVLAVGETDA